MNWKTWLLLFLALAAGSVASFGVKTAFFTEKDAQTAKSDDFTPKERLLVADGALPAGTELNAQNVRLTLTAERDVPRDGIFTFEGIAGSKTTRDLKDGEPISLYDLESVEETQTEDVSFVPPGYVVVPIEVCSATKANGGANYLKTTKLDNLVKPGDVVDLVVVKEDASSRLNRRLVTDPVAQDVSVFSVRDENQRTSEGVARSAILTALLSKDQVEIVRKASEEGKIKIVVRSTSELSYEERREQDDFLNDGLISSIKNNDAVFDRSDDDLSDSSDESSEETNDESDVDTGLLAQDEDSTSDDSAGEKGVFVNVSRKVEVDETTVAPVEPAYEAQDDVLSDSEVILGEEKAEDSSNSSANDERDLLIDLPATEETGEFKFRSRKPKNDFDSALDNPGSEETIEIDSEDEEENEAKGDAESCASSLDKSNRENGDKTDNVEQRPRIFSPYATRGSNAPRRHTPKTEQRRLTDDSENRIF